MNGFADRLTEGRYGADEPVTFGVAPVGSEPEWLAHVPERLFGRLQELGAAYELHLLPVVDPNNKTRLNAAQCQTLQEELLFVAGVSTDHLVRSHVAAIVAVLGRALNSPVPLEVVIVGP